MTDAALILWFRRDLRCLDNPMLAAAVATGRPLIPVFVLDPETEAIGAAARWRLGLGLEAFGARLAALGSRLILRRGDALEQVQHLMAETGAAGVFWSRSYDPATRRRDEAVKAALKAEGAQARSFPGFLLHEPWDVMTGEGGPYRVYTPFWNSVRGRDLAECLPAPGALRAPGVWPDSERIAEWRLGAAMNRGAALVLPHQRVGEAAAQARLADFLAQGVAGYKTRRDLLDEAGTSGLSENLTYGEISPRQIWHEGRRAMMDGAAGAEQFLKELVWRDFAWHLLHHFPQLPHQNWRPQWEDFAWRPDNADAERWRRGMTGEPVVDAAMRQLYVTGTMHNRARMIVASYLTKHLLTDWRVGLTWFADTLTDWDPASNAMGWQWVAGCGPDAAPYFRIFNPATQAKTYDPDARYRRRFVAELTPKPDKLALDFFAAAPKAWAIRPTSPYPPPLIALEAGRARALAAFAQLKA